MEREENGEIEKGRRLIRMEGIKRPKGWRKDLKQGEREGTGERERERQDGRKEMDGGREKEG